jgi:hypothetical protein
MPFVTITVKFFTAFGNGQVKIIATGFSYIKKVSPAFPCTDALTVDALHFFVVVFVRHCFFVFLVFNESLI